MENSMTCGICQSCFSAREELIKHMLIHIQVERCEHCNGYFPELACINQHACIVQYRNRNYQPLAIGDAHQIRYYDDKKNTSNYQHQNSIGFDMPDMSIEINNQGQSMHMSNLPPGHDSPLEERNTKYNDSRNQSSESQVFAERLETKTTTVGKDGVSNHYRNEQFDEEVSGTCVADTLDKSKSQNDDNAVEDSQGTVCSDETRRRKSIIDGLPIHCTGSRLDKKIFEQRQELFDPATKNGSDVDEKTDKLKCEICGKCFESSRACKVHQATHPGGFVSDCKFCGKHFKNGSNLARHMRMHRGEKPFSCKICGKKYADHKTVLIHERVHTGETPHRCDRCGKRFSNPKSYSYHLKQHVGQKIRCETCGKTFASPANLIVHMKIHGDKEFLCDICDKGFYQLGNLRRHHKTHDGEELGTEMVMKLDMHNGLSVKSTHIRRKTRQFNQYDKSNDFEGEKSSPKQQKVLRSSRLKAVRTVSNTIQCGVCEKEFTDYTSLKNHIDLHVKPEVNNSEESTDSESREVVNALHGQDDSQSSAACFKIDKGRNCKSCITSGNDSVMGSPGTHQCEKDTGNRSDSDKSDSKDTSSDSGVLVSNTSGDQSDHFTTGPDKVRKKYKKAIKNRICEICGKAYSSVKRLKLHREEHDSPPEARYTCETCGKSFNRLSGMTRHRKSHGKSKIFICEYCHKSFSCKSKQEIHTRIHTGERPYKCRDCDKTFAAKSGYHQHRQLHELGKVQCQVCSKTLTNKSYLKRHMRIHTQEKPYKCQVCGEAFYMYGTYRNHRLAHQGIPPKVYTKKQPATCEVCGKYFLSKYYLISHMRLHTGEKPFVCDICGRGFVQGHGLRRHLQFHEKEKCRPEKKFQCQVCHNFYPDLKNLQRHMIYHNRDRNCKCQFCDKAYIRPSHLKRHMIDTHKMNPRTSQKAPPLPEPNVVSVPQTQSHASHPPLPPACPPVPLSACTTSAADASVPLSHVSPAELPVAPMGPPPISGPHAQQFHQSQDSLHIHTMEPAMFSYF